MAGKQKVALTLLFQSMCSLLALLLALVLALVLALLLARRESKGRPHTAL